MIRILIIGMLVLLVAACATAPGLAPVINKSPHRIIPATTTAMKGDSIYSIAWRFGLDYKKVAKWNGLGKPYAIRPGQRLRLRSTGSATPAAVAGKPKTETPAAAPKIAKPGVIPKAAEPAQPAATAATAATTAAPSQWNWPAKGKLIGKFSRNKGQNGIKIAGAAGSAIRSTAAGEVVYAGEGLRGYGKLIIVKHSPSYLSAYAHNRKIMVAEGERIASGQQIAQMGNTGADRTMLHFEIRKNGDPLDPLKFLN